MRVERITDVDAVLAATDLFDGPVRREWAARFLSLPGHHLLLAYDGSSPVGMVTGVELTHPDKGTEMFLYELGVAADQQRRGIGRSLVTALADLARDRGCYGMWVLTDLDNPAAQATYRAAGADQGVEGGVNTMLTWQFPTGR